jgi:hypothetical protein
MPVRMVVVCVVAALLVALLLGALGGLRVRRVLESRTSRSRTRRGLAAEKGAEKLLRKHGYRVHERSVAGSYEAQVDGSTYEVKLSADYLVTRDGALWVAEVKTGDAARFAYSETRRQMLEYQLAFGAHGVLLVDADAGLIHEVRFPLAAARATAGAGTWLAYACALSAAVLLAWWRLR